MTQKKQVIELPLEWVVTQYVPRNSITLVVARCNSRIEAMRLMSAITTADAALTPCVAVYRATEVHIVTGRSEQQKPA